MNIKKLKKKRTRSSLAATASFSCGARVRASARQPSLHPRASQTRPLRTRLIPQLLTLSRLLETTRIHSIHSLSAMSRLPRLASTLLVLVLILVPHLRRSITRHQIQRTSHFHKRSTSTRMASRTRTQTTSSTSSSS